MDLGSTLTMSYYHWLCNEEFIASLENLYMHTKVQYIKAHSKPSRHSTALKINPVKAVELALICSNACCTVILSAAWHHDVCKWASVDMN